MTTSRQPRLLHSYDSVSLDRIIYCGITDTCVWYPWITCLLGLESLEKFMSDFGVVNAIDRLTRSVEKHDHTQKRIAVALETIAKSTEKAPPVAPLPYE